MYDSIFWVNLELFTRNGIPTLLKALCKTSKFPLLIPWIECSLCDVYPSTYLFSLIFVDSSFFNFYFSVALLLISGMGIFTWYFPIIYIFDVAANDVTSSNGMVKIIIGRIHGVFQFNRTKKLR